VLAGDVTNHSNPRMYWQPMSLDTEAPLSRPQCRVHFHTMPGHGSLHTVLNLEGTLEVSERFAQPSAWTQRPPTGKECS
jgi:hypothetical protein